MSVKKAIGILDILIENKAQVRSKIFNLIKQWGYDGQDVMTRNARMISSSLSNDIYWFQDIKRQLLPEQHRTKIGCRHPKKDHDIADGQRYCMNCNMDL